MEELYTQRAKLGNYAQTRLQSASLTIPRYVVYVFLSILLFVLVGWWRFRGRHFRIVSLQDVRKHGI